MKNVTILLAVLAVLALTVPAGAAVQTWDGGGANTLWATVANWSGDTYATDDDLTVGNSVAGFTPTSAVDVKAASGGKITLDGAGTGVKPAAVLSGYLYISIDGTAVMSTLDIKNGATVKSANGAVGWDNLGVGNWGKATVTGPGSKWTNTLLISIGDRGAAASTLDILDGGVVETGNTLLGNLGSNGSTVNVSGANSKLITGGLQVGRAGGSVGCELNITAGGTVTAGSPLLGTFSGSLGKATISGAGSTWTNSGTLNVGYAALGGKGEVKVIGVGPVITAASYVQAANSNLVSQFDAVGIAKISVTGAATLAGTWTVVDPGSAPFGTFDILTASSISGNFGTIVLPNTTDWSQGITGGTLWVSHVPEPATMVLLGLGGIGVLLRRRRK